MSWPIVRELRVIAGLLREIIDLAQGAETEQWGVELAPGDLVTFDRFEPEGQNSVRAVSDMGRVVAVWGEMADIAWQVRGGEWEVWTLPVRQLGRVEHLAGPDRG